ncbi:MAG: S24 family peptidase [Oscillospiraceae bacterium]
MMNLKNIRKERGYTQKFMGESLGMTQQGYASYENCKTSPDPGTLVKISEILQCTVDMIIGCEQGTTRRTAGRLSKKTHIFTEIPFGVSTNTAKHAIDELDLGEEYSSDDSEYFALLVSGDSMYPYYMDGDVVIVRKQTSAVTGDDVVVWVGREYAIIRRYYNSVLGVTLRALNSAGETKIYSYSQMEKLPVTILGIVVELRRRVR